jgi:hypothetical protein
MYKVYESNVEPYLRFFHEAHLTPSGWLSVSDVVPGETWNAARKKLSWLKV